MSLFADDWPPSSPPEHAPLMSVDEVEIGQRAVAYTVFRGNKIEPFVGKVQGVALNYFGPQRHIVIIRFEGERLEHTGIVHGMSGSPVYINGKLLGAVSLALSPFPKEPLAGVTPISYMLDEARDTGEGPGSQSPARLVPTRSGWKVARAEERAPSSVQRSDSGFGQGGEGQSSLASVSDLRRSESGPGREQERPDDLAAVPNRFPSNSSPFAFHPLRTPLIFGGFDAEVVEHYRHAFDRFPVAIQLGGGAAGDARAATPEEIATAAQGIVPGAPVASVLIEGDVSLSATGTVTYRDRDTVFAFGHPFLQQGPVSMPMASADIIATVADQTYPYKLANTEVLVGTVTYDRVTAIVGHLGSAPQMIPLSLRIFQGDELRTHFDFRLAEQANLTPTLLQLALANSFKKRWRYFEEGSYRMTARIKLAGGPEIVTRAAYSIGATETTTVFDLIRDISEPFGILYDNPFRPVTVERVDIDVEADVEKRLYTIEDVFVGGTRVRPGETLEVKVALSRHRGERLTRTLTLPIPAGLKGGNLRLRVADARKLEEAGTAGGRVLPSQARDLDQLISILRRSRRGDCCYIQLLRESPGLVVGHEEMPALPASALALLQTSSSSGDFEPLDQAVLSETELEFDGAVVGAQELSLEVLPSL